MLLSKNDFENLILIFKELNNDSVINELFKVAGFTYGPLLGLFAFGILTTKNFNDKHVILITVVSILITAVYSYILPTLIVGFKPGFEVIIVNGLMTIILLFMDSTFFKTQP